MQTLVIIESPGKRKKLEAILGAGYTVRASFGHVRDLPKASMGVEPPTYKPSYVVEDDRAKTTLAGLKKAAAEAERVLLATDPDREGEAIAWHLAQALALKAPERITYQEITPKAVRAAVAAPRPLNLALVHAQEARRVLDRLVGYQASPALSDKAAQRLSAGRVQSPAVRLVVDRERAIRGFKAVKHYGAELRFDAPAPWRAQWKPQLDEGQEHITDSALAQLAADVRRVRVEAFADSETRAAPPAPFTTSTLQQRSQAALKFKPKKTMDLAQKLYEQGAITYMRTDSPNLSAEAFEQITGYARANNLPVIAEQRRWKAKGNAQEAHEAIRPSHIDQLDAGETEDEKALYRLIWQRAVASQLEDARFAVRTAELVAIDAAGVASHYQARGRTLIYPGWKALYDDGEEGDDDAKAEAKAEANNPVPALSIGDTLDVPAGILLTKTTKAPARYTMATLVRELEANGIGRPATYAAILENIANREYITEDKKGQLAATPIGEALVDALVGTCAFVELDYTRELESDLDAIAEGEKRYLEVVSAANARLLAELAKLAPSAPAHACPECGKAMRKRDGKHGAFWACSGYPECRTTMHDKDGTPVARAARTPAPPVSADAPTCPQCSKPLRRNTRTKADDPKGKGWDFFGCTGFPKCKATFKPDADGLPIFPATGSTT